MIAFPSSSTGSPLEMENSRIPSVSTREVLCSSCLWRCRVESSTGNECFKSLVTFLCWGSNVMLPLHQASTNANGAHFSHWDKLWLISPSRIKGLFSPTREMKCISYFMLKVCSVEQFLLGKAADKKNLIVYFKKDLIWHVTAVDSLPDIHHSRKHRQI